MIRFRICYFFDIRLHTFISCLMNVCVKLLYTAARLNFCHGGQILLVLTCQSELRLTQSYFRWLQGRKANGRPTKERTRTSEAEITRGNRKVCLRCIDQSQNIAKWNRICARYQCKATARCNGVEVHSFVTRGLKFRWNKRKCCRSRCRHFISGTLILKGAVEVERAGTCIFTVRKILFPFSKK
jgi:hypothetical protein